MRRLRFLTRRHPAPSTNMVLGLLLTFNASAVNAGGFVRLHMYTSHMTGFASQLADGLVLATRSCCSMRSVLCRHFSAVHPWAQCW
ncbi:uncharacterized membrane protein YoaK (UPF0700 family) [Variovorax boronicumulans]|nr:uncharacterized membrane protein YoaK (UPF0700 family) [Variovorax boronicumulans]